MANVQIQLCGLIFDLLLIFFVLRHESVGLYSEKIFKQCVLVYSSCIVLDILSCIAIINDEKIPGFLVLLSCKAYLVSLALSAYYGFLYTYNDVKRLRENYSFQIGTFVVAIIGIIFICILPINYLYDGKDILYSYGYSAMMTYIVTILYIGSSIIITFVYAKQMNPHRRNAVRAWMLIETVMAAIQFIFPELLVVGFGSALGMYILYSELENPEVYLDRITGCFSEETFKKYVEQEYEQKKPFSVIFVCNEKEWKVGDETEKRILVEMSEFLNSFAYSKLFRIANHDFALVYDKNEKEMNEIESAVNLDVIRQRFAISWPELSRSKFLYVPDGHITSSVEEARMGYTRNRDLFEQGEDMRILDESSVNQIREFNSMVVEIGKALEEDRVQVYYQPIYSIETGKFVSAEALVRMVGTDGKLIMPMKFIPVAEETGLIEKIGERVFEKTCECIKQNDLRNKGIDYVEINLSVTQCENSLLSTKFQEIISNHSVSPDEINLEITESSTLRSKKVLLKNMNELMRYGCSFSLDDFGTGESNLNYIVDMPVKLVKFDRSMVQEYFKNEKAKLVMSATVKMIKELGLKIVAEGIETEEQVNEIKNLEIDYIQGYYYSKPLSESDFIKFIDAHNM